jgi:hypothetical protein
VRLALIAIGDADTAHAGLLAGRSVARHQIDFALALGCKKIILFGHGAAPEAFALRHAAEATGAQVQVVRGVRDLPATVRGDDSLLVLAHGLLPDSRRAFELLSERHGILVLPAEAGWSAGFERLDLTSAWGGAMLVPGRLVASLDQLPEDAEPIAGLLRIGRQAGMPEIALPESELAEGRWQIVRGENVARALEPAWLRRRLAPVSPFRVTAWLARSLVAKFGLPWVGKARARMALVAGAVWLAAGAIAAAWFGAPAAGFAILVPAALAIEADDALSRLGQPIFRVQSKSSRVSLMLHLMWDASFAILGALSIGGSRAHRLFAPLVTVGLLHLPPPWPKTRWLALPADRGILALLMATAAMFGLAEGAFMLLALLLLGMRFAAPRENAANGHLTV